MEKLALNRKKEIDNNIDLPRKNKIYKEQKKLYLKHKKGEIDTNFYFQGMVQLMSQQYYSYTLTMNIADKTHPSNYPN